MSNISALRSIAGVTESDRPQPSDMVGETQMQASEDWLSDESNQTGNPITYFEAWNNATRDRIHTYNSKEYWWETEKKLHPAGPQAALNSKLDSILQEVAAKANTEQQEYYYRDNAKKWPREILEAILPSYEKTLTINSRKSLERARLASHMSATQVHVPALEKMIRDSGGLDPNTSTSHDLGLIIRAANLDALEFIGLNDSRQLTIPSENGPVPLETMQDPEIESEVAFINALDLHGVYEPMVTRLKNEARLHQHQEDRRTLALAFQEVHTPTIPRWAKSNIIIDYASEKDNGPELTLKAISDTMESSMTNFPMTNEELTSEFIGMVKDINNKIERRLS